ncbi:hypothetical protein [Parasitella parasitica]|uniref:Serine/threonine-protein phosphatase 2A activator n=1 Tax=Parasitella parasitica TaxID=35722 RepID=A0A0B7MYS2_9FUNG|nr:hypothetical protein [Parasitella parasitica]
MLDTIDAWIDDFPPLDNPQRFGNKAFRSWAAKLAESSSSLMKTALSDQLHVAIPELSEYLNKGFGNETRIDYGSGHELSFAAWLAGIALLGGFTADDHQAIVLRIFVRYLELVRRLQITYSLEPAGSHGVWGLDDFQFLPYVWGSAQLINHPKLTPRSVVEDRSISTSQREVVDTFADDYMYFRCIQYILQVNTGMSKMYVAEVLKKVPVVQHFRFVLQVDPKPVYYIGPATRENPMSQIRTKLLGNVYFNDAKIKWNRITLHFTGKAGLNIYAASSTLPSDVVSSQSDLQESSPATTHLETTVTLCDVEKELIFSHEKVIDFGFYLPPYLPPSIKTKHAFVEYTLSVVCSSSGPFSKKQKVETPVTVCRHYLPSPSSLIPSVEYHGVREWFEWSAEVPKATAIEAGEIVMALRWSVEKELVEVDKIEFSIQELETYRCMFVYYRFSTKAGVHNLPPMVTQFPNTTYHPPTFSNSSETHFIRTAVPLIATKRAPNTIRTHHFDPFLEISHRLKLEIYFVASATIAPPLELVFPIIITDFPPNTKADYFVDPSSPVQLVSTASGNTSSSLPQPISSAIIQPGGDEVPCVDLDLPEYTPRYEDVSTAP